MPRSLLLVPGSTRPGSSNVAVLEAAVEAAPEGVDVRLYADLRRLPAFVPGEAPPPEVAALLGLLAAADGVLFSTPEYAGSLPGSLKNLLDWTVGGGELYGRRVGWLDVAHPGRGAGARAQLVTVLGYVGAVVVPDACLTLPPVRTADDRPHLTAALRALVG